MAENLGLTPDEAIYNFVLALDNVVILNGTTNEKHMIDELFKCLKKRKWASEHPKDWAKYLDSFKMVLDETSIS